jgi:eukaryotic-like serine/threonine-protein kinase
MLTMERPKTMKLESCPADETLHAYLLGETDDGVSDSIDLHLTKCTACNERLEALELNTESGSVESIEQNLLAAAIAAVKQTPSETIPDSVGSYRLLQEIGRGGMGRVYLGEHLSLKKRVAIKLLSNSLGNRQAIERFEREVQAIGRLNHPSIVTATDADTTGPNPFLVMEFIDGVDLATFLRKHGPLPIAEACEIIRQVAVALQHAHHVPMVHRDIKPSNIMIDGNGRVKLLDFGLVQLKSSPHESSELTSAGQCLGTLDYMSPEQAEQSSQIEPRSDLYSLGVTLYRLLSSRFPLNFLASQSVLQKLAIIQKHQLTPIQTWKPELPDQLAKLVMSMIAKDPSQRPMNAATARIVLHLSRPG